MNELCIKELGTYDFSKGFMYSVHQVYTLVQKRLEQSLSEKEAISFSQFMILVGFVCHTNSPVSQASIASFSHLTEATVSRHISVLVTKGYLSKEENKENRRKHLITITKKGLSAFAHAEKIIDKELITIFKDIKDSDRKSIMKNFNNVLLQLLTKK
jgi:DNA-binding MarR family transcriptional regulator